MKRKNPEYVAGPVIKYDLDFIGHWTGPQGKEHYEDSIEGEIVIDSFRIDPKEVLNEVLRKLKAKSDLASLDDAVIVRLEIKVEQKRKRKGKERYRGEI